MARHGLFTLLVLLSVEFPSARARRAIGKHEPVEAGVGARGEVWSSVWDDAWVDKSAADCVGQEAEPPANTEEEAPRESVSAGLGSPEGGTVWTAGVTTPTEGPLQESVTERGLVTSDTSASSILQEHMTWDAAETSKRFDGETLGYVTPWHGRGYDFARTFRSKFTYICPVWYQLRGQEVPAGGGKEESGSTRKQFTLLGGHDFDGAWVSDVRDGVDAGDAGAGTGDGTTTKIVPRVVLEMRGRFQLSGGDLLEMAALLVEEAILRRYHGFVLDIPLSEGIEQFLFAIVHVSSQRGVDLLLIQTIRAGARLSERQLDQLAPVVHRFSLMTYDYAGGSGGIPNSPLRWVRECVEAFAPAGTESDLRSKVLLGIPFYGYDDGRTINYDDIVSLLRRVEDGEEDAIYGGVDEDNAGVDVRWDASTREHVIRYRGNDDEEHVATYATLKFIQERIELARELGVGIAVWELGQGMPYFFDLL